MNYSKTLDLLFKRNESAIKLGLQNIRTLLEQVGYKAPKHKIIHVAGTNGKGSTCNYLNQLLLSYGYKKIGVYTSPHLVDFCERIQINNKWVTKKWITTWLTIHKLPIDKINPTFFEITTAMALCYFAEQKCDIIILEVGLGGRLDSTNIVNPDISIITSISYDHQQYLGNTLTKILNEKMEIIKKNKPVIVGETRPHLLKKVRQYCSDKNSPLFIVRQGLKQREYIKGLTKVYNLPFNTSKEQYHNLQLSLIALEVMHKKPLLSLPSIKHKLGCQNIFFHPALPTLILDGCHNKAGFVALSRRIKELYPNKKWVAIYSSLQDKSYSSAIEWINTVSTKKYFVELTKHKRHLPYEVFLNSISSQEKQSWSKWSQNKSLQREIKNTPKKQGVLIFGSFYMIELFIKDIMSLYSLSSDNKTK